MGDDNSPAARVRDTLLGMLDIVEQCEDEARTGVPGELYHMLEVCEAAAAEAAAASQATRTETRQVRAALSKERTFAGTLETMVASHTRLQSLARRTASGASTPGTASPTKGASSRSGSPTKHTQQLADLMDKVLEQAAAVRALEARVDAASLHAALAASPQALPEPPVAI